MSDLRDTFIRLFKGPLSGCTDPENVTIPAAIADAAMAEVEKRFPRATAQPTEAAEVWTHLEILGHREHDALVSDEVRRGQEGVRVRLACPLGHVVLDRWYRASAIYSEERDSDAEVRGLAWAAATCQHPDCEAARQAKAQAEAARQEQRQAVASAIGARAASLYRGILYALRNAEVVPGEVEVATLGQLFADRAPAADPRWAPLAGQWPELVRELQSAIAAADERGPVPDEPPPVEASELRLPARRRRPGVLMLAKASINWTDWIWPIAEGCTPVSPGCRDCWASEFVGSRLAQSERFRGLTVLGGGRHVFNGTVRFQPQLLDAPLRHRKPGRVFVAPRSDLFHESVTDEQIAAVFGVMAASPHLTFQVLTKRAERAARWFDTQGIAATAADAVQKLLAVARGHIKAVPFGPGGAWGERWFLHPWPLPNVHVGVTVEDQRHADARIPHLLAIPAAVRWLSVEPMLGPVDLTHYLDGPGNQCSRKWCGHGFVDWVVCGGESGHRARPFALEWAVGVRRQCAAAGVPFFFKQAGSNAYLENANLWSVAWMPHGRAVRFRQVPEGVTAAAAVGLRLRHPHGADLGELPEALRIREWPLPVRP